MLFVKPLPQLTWCVLHAAHEKQESGNSLKPNPSSFSTRVTNHGDTAIRFLATLFYDGRDCSTEALPTIVCFCPIFRHRPGPWHGFIGPRFHFSRGQVLVGVCVGLVNPYRAAVPFAGQINSNSK